MSDLVASGVERVVPLAVMDDKSKLQTRVLPTDISQSEVENWVDLALQWIGETVTECPYTKNLWSDPVCKKCDTRSVCGVLLDIIDNVRMGDHMVEVEQDFDEQLADNCLFEFGKMCSDCGEDRSLCVEAERELVELIGEALD